MPRITDAVSMVPAQDAVRGAFVAVDAIQSLPAGLQVAAVATLFTAFCDHTGLDPSQLIDASRRRLFDHDVPHTQRVEAAALAAYVKGEIAR